MDKEYLYAGGGFVAGLLVALAIFSFAPERQMGGESMTMQQMVSSLDGKSGDEFDMAFVDAMIAHHEGAIEMARLAQASSGRQEVRGLADGIISAQESEIAMMRQWQEDWRK